MAAEAAESSASRQYLLKQSLIYTAQHPLLGVGPGQFPNYEGKERRDEGKRGSWHVTHNFLTQVSSECGIPALIFMVMGLLSALLLVQSTYKLARQKGFLDIANACFCYHMAMVGYLVSIVFLAQAYSLYLPMMVGLAIALSMSAARHMSARAIPTLARAPTLPVPAH